TPLVQVERTLIPNLGELPGRGKVGGISAKVVTRGIRARVAIRPREDRQSEATPCPDLSSNPSWLAEAKLFWLLVRRCWSGWNQGPLVITPPRFKDSQPRNGNQWCRPPHRSLARTGERREQTWRHCPRMPRAPQPWHWKPVAGQHSDRLLASQDSIFCSSGPKPTPERFRACRKAQSHLVICLPPDAVRLHCSRRTRIPLRAFHCRLGNFRHAPRIPIPLPSAAGPQLRRNTPSLLSTSIRSREESRRQPGV